MGEMSMKVQISLIALSIRWGSGGWKQQKKRGQLSFRFIDFILHENLCVHREVIGRWLNGIMISGKMVNADSSNWLWSTMKNWQHEKLKFKIWLDSVKAMLIIIMLSIRTTYCLCLIMCNTMMIMYVIKNASN